jgi:hypothetical protein
MDVLETTQKIKLLMGWEESRMQNNNNNNNNNNIPAFTKAMSLLNCPRVGYI